MKIFLLFLFLFYSSCAVETVSWNKENFPLKIYADATLNEEDIEALRASISLHNSQLEKTILILIDESQYSDIIVYRVDELPSSVEGKAYIESGLPVEIEFLNGLDFSRRVCALSHELGHALGHIDHDPTEYFLMSARGTCSTYYTEYGFSDFLFYKHFKNWFVLKYKDLFN